MSLASESVLAAVGLDQVLDGRPTYNQEQQADAAKFAQRVRALLLKFMGGATSPVSDLPDFDYERVSKLLNADDDANTERTAKLHQLLPPEMSDEVLATASRIVGMLEENFPRRVWKTSARVHTDPPEPFQLGRFQRRWAVACDPMIVLRDLIEGQLDLDEVQALADFYPDLYQAVLDQVDDAIATMKARRGDKWDLDAKQDRAIKTLVQAPTFDPALAADYVQLAQTKTAPQPRATSKVVKLDNSEQLPGQRA
jgi:hypothetical protein